MFKIYYLLLLTSPKPLLGNIAIHSAVLSFLFVLFLIFAQATPPPCPSCPSPSPPSPCVLHVSLALLLLRAPILDVLVDVHLHYRSITVIILFYQSSLLVSLFTCSFELLILCLFRRRGASQGLFNYFVLIPEFRSGIKKVLLSIVLLVLVRDSVNASCKHIQANVNGPSLFQLSS